MSEQQAVDQQFMQRALELARRGTGLAAPNPMVGCVLLDGAGKIVGEGWHEYERLDHAEVAALKAAEGKARGGTAYVTLEPCNHTGRTGPCAQALIDAGVKRVVIATRDPHGVAAGGVERLRKAGVAITLGVEERAAQRLNEGFACWCQHKRPFVLMKVAMTLDGRIAPAAGRHRQGEPYWITSEESRAEVQLMRAAVDAVVTGVDTVLADDPMMTDRSGLKRGRKLLRVVMDSALRTPFDSKLVKSVDEDLVIFTTVSDRLRIAAFEERGVEVVSLSSERGRVPIRAMLEELGSRSIHTLLTETGTRLNTALLEGGHVDRLQLYVSPQLMGTEAQPAFASLHNPIALVESGAELEVRQVGRDLALSALLHSPWPES